MNLPTVPKRWRFTSISTRIIAGLSLIVLVTAVSSILFLQAFDRYHRELDRTTKVRLHDLLATSKLSEEVRRMSAMVRQLAAAKDGAARRALTEEMDQVVARQDRAIVQLRTYGISPAHLDRIKQLRDLTLGQWGALATAVAPRREGDPAPPDSIAARPDLAQLVPAAEARADELVRTLDRVSQTWHAAVLDQAEQLRVEAARFSGLLYATPLFCAAAAVLIGMYIRRSVTLRVRRLRDLMHEQAEGRAVAIPTAGQDEIAEMARSAEHFVKDIGRREKALTQSLALLDSIFSAVSDPVMVIGRDYRILRANEAAGGDGVVGRPCFEVMKHGSDPREDAGHDCLLQQVLATQAPVKSLHRHETEDGTEIFGMSAYPIRDEAGEITGLVEFRHDVTERLRAEEELAQYRDRLEELVAQRTAELKERNVQLQQEIVEHQEAEEARLEAERELEGQRVLSLHSDRLRSLGEMAAGIAHELNQPLSGVRGLAEYCLMTKAEGRELSEERLQQKLGLIVDQADRMTHIIEHVRLFAREAPKPEVQPVAVNEVVNWAVETIGQQFRAHGLALECDLAEGLPSVLANPFSLEEVILNLLSNARDAVEERNAAGEPPAPAKIQVRTLPDPEAPTRRALTEVADSGSGVPPEILDRVFDPFFTTKEPSKGTGLGLAISRSIVEQFGGTIHIESELGQGTTVTISLPVEDEGNEGREQITNV